jgi:CubicO group peptidase (beta-lactamase class C family)
MILEEPKRKITIQDVFRHTAGFDYGSGDTPMAKAYRQAGIVRDKISLKELVDKLATLPLLYHPGERWVYSYAHDVQAYLIEYFSGMRFDDFVHEKIFKPLGMKNAVFGIPKDYVARFATIYGPGESGILKAREDPAENVEAWRRNLSSAPSGSGGGGISCAAMDYLLFSQMLLNGGQLGGVRILGKKTVELMTSNHLPAQIGDIGDIQRMGYGLGVGVVLDPTWSGNLVSKGAFGWGGAAGTWAIIDPKEQMISLFFTQQMPRDDFALKFQTLVYQAIID